MERVFVKADENEKGSFYSKYDDTYKKELNDSEARIITSSRKIVNGDEVYVGNLGSIIKYDKLYKEIPEIKNIYCEFKILNINYNKECEVAKYARDFGGHEEFIEIKANNKKRWAEFLFHELQHSIQYHQKLSLALSDYCYSPSYHNNNDESICLLQERYHYLVRSGRYDEARNVFNKSASLIMKCFPKDYDYTIDFFKSNALSAVRLKYLRTFGEIEAREVASRVFMDKKQRNKIKPDYLRGIEDVINGNDYYARKK